MTDIPGIVGSISELPPIIPREAIQAAMSALDYINQFGFLTEAVRGNETTQGAHVLHRELATARALLSAVLAS